MWDETKAEIKRLKAKMKPFVWETQPGSYKGIVAFGKDHQKFNIPFTVGPGESVKEKVLKEISKVTGIEVAALESEEVLSNVVRRQEVAYDEWKERGMDKDIQLSRNIIDALNLLQKGDVEFGGYILADSKQEIHVIEGERNRACPLKPGIPTITVHTHPMDPSLSAISTIPSGADLAHFFKCPTTVAEIIFGQKDNLMMGKPTKPNAYDNVEKEDFDRLFNAIATDIGMKVRLEGQSYRCGEQSSNECDIEIERTYNELYGVLEKEFGINIINFSKGQTVTLRARGG